MNFEGKKALVTGATQGIGRGIALALSNHGASVVALGRNADLLDKLKEIDSRITTVQCDVTDGLEAIEAALQSLQPFHLLVNNAGIALNKPFLQFTNKDIDKVFNVNFKGLMFTSQAVAKEMIKHKIPGSIVHLSSQASMRPLHHHGVYCSSKAAVDMLGKVMALELGEHGIRVNCVNPTVVMTTMGKAQWSDPIKAQSLLDRMPIKRFAEVDDVVNSVLFLLSDQSAMTTGATLPVDGGYTSV